MMIYEGERGLMITLWPFFFVIPIDAARPTMPAPTITISNVGMVGREVIGQYISFVAIAKR